MAFKILLAGGGTGGHVSPLIAVAQELKKQSNDVKLKFIGTGGLLAQEAEKVGISSTRILAPKWRRYFSVLNFVDLLKTPIGFVQAFFSVALFMPDVVFSKGGYGAFLPLLVAKILFIPTVVHDSDAFPGTVSRWSGHGAKRVFLGFESAKKYFEHDRVEVVGVPLRPEFLVIKPKLESIAEFKLDDKKPVILITGASQGAQKINEILILSLPELVKKYHIIHQCGAKNYNAINTQVTKIVDEEKDTFGKMIQESYRLLPVLSGEQMSAAYSAADVVISRSSSMLFEIAAMGKPAIVVPLPSAANDHQALNAQEFRQHGATVLSELNFTSHILVDAIDRAYENRFDLAAKVRGFAKPGAATAVAKYLLTFR